MAARILLALPLAFAVGCASAEKFAHVLTGGPKPALASATPETVLPGGRDDLKDPARVDLSYAGFQAQLGNLDEARAAYGRVLDADDDSLAAVLGLARLDELAGRNEQAERNFRRAVEIAPNDPRCLTAVANFYANQERHPEAIAMYRRAVALAPDDTNVAYGLGLALARTDQPDAALPHLTAAIGAAAAHYNVGYLALERGQLARAEKAFLQASVLDPELADAVVMLDEVRRLDEAQGLIAKNRPQPADAAVRQVSGTTEQAPTYAPGHPLLGSGYRSKLTPQQLEQLRNQRR